jgi:hypothetical protein
MRARIVDIVWWRRMLRVLRWGAKIGGMFWGEIKWV